MDTFTMLIHLHASGELEENGLPEDLKNDAELALKAVRFKGCLLAYFSEEIRDDIELVIKACKWWGVPLLAAASQTLRNDPERAKELIKELGPNAYRFLLHGAKSDWSLSTKVFLIDESKLRLSPVDIKGSEVFAKHWFSSNPSVGSSLKFFTSTVKRLPAVIAAAMNSGGRYSSQLSFISLVHVSTAELEEMLKTFGGIMHHFKEKWTDRDAVLRAFKSGFMVRHMHGKEVVEMYKADREVLQAACLFNPDVISRLEDIEPTPYRLLGEVVAANGMCKNYLKFTTMVELRDMVQLQASSADVLYLVMCAARRMPRDDFQLCSDGSVRQRVIDENGFQKIYKHGPWFGRIFLRKILRDYLGAVGRKQGAIAKLALVNLTEDEDDSALFDLL